jgi:hypothetical protein
MSETVLNRRHGVHLGLKYLASQPSCLSLKWISYLYIRDAYISVKIDDATLCVHLNLASGSFRSRRDSRVLKLGAYTAAQKEVKILQSADQEV